MRQSLRRAAVPVLAATLGATVAVGLTGPGGAPAAAQTAPPPLSTAPNPWVLTETNPAAEGLRINAATGANGQPFIVYDYGPPPTFQRQPIAGVNRAGGMWVAGDNFTVFSGSDIYHGQITLSPDNPAPAVCVRPGQLWIGGPEGRFWRCADLDGAGPSPLAWWPA